MPDAAITLAGDSHIEGWPTDLWPEPRALHTCGWRSIDFHRVEATPEALAALRACEAYKGGPLCGHCHQCGAPTGNGAWCPKCGSSDYDDD